MLWPSVLLHNFPHNAHNPYNHISDILLTFSCTNPSPLFTRNKSVHPRTICIMPTPSAAERPSGYALRNYLHAAC